MGSIPGSEDPLEKETATDSSILAWEISWPEEPGRLQSMGLQRIRHNLVTKQQQQELKNKQTMMNNTVNAIKNILLLAHTKDHEDKWPFTEHFLCMK